MSEQQQTNSLGRAESCATCRFFSGPPTNWCLRRSPSVLLLGMRSNKITQETAPVVDSFFPQTQPNLWCGEYERGRCPVAAEFQPLASADEVTSVLNGMEVEGTA